MVERALTRICLVESNETLRRDLAAALERSGFGVAAYPTAADARRDSRESVPSVRVLDLSSAGVGAWLEEETFAGPTILLAAESVSPGANWRGDPGDLEILYKPFSLSILESRILARLPPRRGSRLDSNDPILHTREPELVALLERARRAARRRTPICLVGEIGTGRRALARQIHDWSSGRVMPFVTLDRACLEASGTHRVEEVISGALARAGQGTVLLVEPAEQIPRVQEVLQSTLRRQGDGGARWLSIAKQPLEQSVREGRLQIELQYRLEVMTLRVPALRDRPLDQAPLCRAIARRVARELGQETPEIDTELAEALARDGFPGNRLGLESRLRGALMQSEGDRARLRAVTGAESTPATAASETSFLNLKALERDTIIRALAHWDGNRTRASEALGISVRTLRNKIRDYGLR
jgi:two-component system response regulator FlrC